MAVEFWVEIPPGRAVTIYA